MLMFVFLSFLRYVCLFLSLDQDKKRSLFFQQTLLRSVIFLCHRCVYKTLNSSCHSVGHNAILPQYLITISNIVQVIIFPVILRTLCKVKFNLDKLQRLIVVEQFHKYRVGKLHSPLGSNIVPKLNFLTLQLLATIKVDKSKLER